MPNTSITSIIDFKKENMEVPPLFSWHSDLGWLDSWSELEHELDSVLELKFGALGAQSILSISNSTVCFCLAFFPVTSLDFFCASDSIYFIFASSSAFFFSSSNFNLACSSAFFLASTSAFNLATSSA